jgi:hypothetical protein
MALTTSLVIAGASTATAQSAGTPDKPDKKALVGSWVETVTFPPEAGGSSSKGVGSFHDDGIMIFSGNISGEPPTVFSSFNGVWTHLQKRTFAYSGLHLMSDLSGNPMGFVKVRGVYTVSKSGNEYEGTSFAEVFNTDGNIVFSVEVTNTGQRIQLELP